MRNPWLIGFLTAIILISGFVALAWATGWDGPDRDHVQTIRIVSDDGSTISPETTLMIEADRRWGPPFPFFFLFPFLFLLGFFLIARSFGPRRDWSRPYDREGPPPWFTEAHNRAHAERTTPPSSAAPTDAG